jgi:hypothetical protein
MVNYTLAVKKPFSNLEKLVIGIILSFIPIVQWIAKGFALECSGLGKTRPSAKMPEWKNYMQLFIKGILSDAILFVYMIPAFVIFLIAAGIAFAPLVTSLISSGIPQQLATSIQPHETGWGLLKNMIQQNWALIIPTLIIAAPIFLIAFILFLAATYLGPIAIMNYVKTNKFNAAFDFNLVFRKTRNFKYFIVWVVTTIIVAVVATILAWIPFIGNAIAYFITGVISFSIYGQIYKEVK